MHVHVIGQAVQPGTPVKLVFRRTHEGRVAGFHCERA